MPSVKGTCAAFPGLKAFMQNYSRVIGMAEGQTALTSLE